MTPTAGGRHCASCQKTVVDFTQKTDAEIIALLTSAAGRTCGRFGADQLQRPLVPAVVFPVASTSRWRGWLAAAVAVWGLREGLSFAAAGQARAAQHAPHPQTKAARTLPVRLLHGVVRDAATRQPLPGVAVFVVGENHRTTTDSAGRFRVRVSAARHVPHTLRLHRFGYHSEQRRVPEAGTLSIALRADASVYGVEVAGVMPPVERQVLGGAPVVMVVTEPVPVVKPSQWHPRTLYDWLLRPFRHQPTSH